MNRAAAWAAALCDLALPGTGMFIATGLKDLVGGIALVVSTFGQETTPPRASDPGR